MPFIKMVLEVWKVGPCSLEGCYHQQIKYGQTEQWTTNTYGVSVWRTIRNLWPKLSESIRYKVGEGTRILFWKDKWIGQNSLMEDFPDLFSLSFCDNPEASIAETWTNQGWNIIFRRLLND